MRLDKAVGPQPKRPPLAKSCAPVKANGAARKAHERDKRAKETRLRGWAYRTRTRKCRRNYPFEKSLKFLSSSHGGHFAGTQVELVLLSAFIQSRRGAARSLQARQTALPFAMRQFSFRRLMPFAIFFQRAQLGQETDQIVQLATQPVHRRRDNPAFFESSPLPVSV